MKSTIRQILLAACLTALSPLAANASLHTLSNLFVFGDSLSDGGNYNRPPDAAYPLSAYPPPPYAGSRYSNGPTAVEYLWQSFNPANPAGFKPSNQGGTNYALGGATTGTFNFNFINPPTPDPIRPYFFGEGGIANQVAQFAGSCTNCFAPASSLFVVWGFPNDVFSNALFALSPSDLIDAGIKNILKAIQTLAGEGATHFLVPNMPDLGATPAFRGGPNAADLTALTQGFNAFLASSLTLLDQALPGEIVQFDTYSTVQRVMQSPSTYGIANATQQCVQHLLDSQCNPNTWLFWDGVHPTTAGHRLLGEQFAAAVPEPATLALLALGLLGIAASRRRRA